MSKSGESPAKKTGRNPGGSRATPVVEDRSSSKKKREIAGFRLIDKIRARSIELGLQDRYIADMIGVTPIYWYSIANGHKKISSLGKEKLKKIAEFLDIPTVQVMNLAEVLDPNDFFRGHLGNQLETSIEQMRNDPAWMCWAPSKEEWESLSVATKIGMVMLYETVFYKSFLSQAKIELPEMKPMVKTFVEEKFVDKKQDSAEADI